MEILLNLIAAIFLIALILGYVWCVSWAIKDAQRCGKSEGFVVLLFWLFGPLAALVWLGVRPTQSLVDHKPEDYDNADDAMAAAARLESIGDWDEALTLYKSVAQRWPEHAIYAANCCADIARKQTAAGL